MRRVSQILFLLTVLLAGGAVAADPPTAQEMIAAADHVRNPGQPFRLTNTLVEYVDGRPRAQTVLVVFAKQDSGSGQFKNLVRFIEPPRDDGKLMLMDGSKLWFYDSASKASVRLSQQQRLLGQSSNGDVITLNLAKDYTAKLVGEESIGDADHQTRDCWSLDLTAAAENAVYGRIEYWLERGTFHPVKGKYYSDSGRLLKVAYFRKYQEQLGGLRPTETVIIDALDPKQVTTMTFSDYRLQDIPEEWFQRDFLPHLKVE